MTTPRSGDGGTGTPRERSAAATKALRRREKRLSGARDTSNRAERTGHGERRTDRAAGDRPARQRPARERAGVDRPNTERPARRAVRRTRSRDLVAHESPTHRRVLVRRSIAVAVPVGVLVVVVALWFTPLLGVRSVEVGGTQRLTADQVRAAAHIASGTPMLRLDTSAIVANVHTLARVGTVDVSREWPSTVRIDITERDPVGFLASSDGAHLVDRTGVDYAVIAKPPAGLPKIDLTTVSPADPRTRAVVGVLAALPQQLRSLVIAVAATTPGNVTLGLTAGRTVRWGDAADSGRKAAVLAALMTRPGKVYDVSSPQLPTVS